MTQTRWKFHHEIAQVKFEIVKIMLMKRRAVSVSTTYLSFKFIRTFKISLTHMVSKIHYLLSEGTLLL